MNLGRMGLVVVLCGAVLFTGCWDRREVDELAIVLSMAIDLADDGESLRVTYEIANPVGLASQQGQGGSTTPLSQIRTVQGVSLLDTNQNLQRELARFIYFGHLQTIIFGESIARKRVDHILDFLERHHEPRRSINIAVTEGEAREILKTAGALEQLAGMRIVQLLQLTPHSGGIVQILGDFLERFSNPGAASLAPLIRVNTDSEQIEVSGAALFMDGHVIGFIDARTTVGLSLALGEARKGTILIGRDPAASNDLPVGFSITKASAHLRPEVRDGKLTAVLEVRLQGNVMEILGGAGHTTHEGWHDLESLFAQTARELVDEAIEITQAWKSDVLQVGKKISRHLPHVWDQVEPEWPDRYAEVEFEVHVFARLIHSGLVKEVLPSHYGGT